MLGQFIILAAPWIIVAVQSLVILGNGVRTVHNICSSLDHSSSAKSGHIREWC